MVIGQAEVRDLALAKLPLYKFIDLTIERDLAVKTLKPVGCQLVGHGNRNGDGDQLIVVIKVTVDISLDPYV